MDDGKFASKWVLRASLSKQKQENNMHQLALVYYTGSQRRWRLLETARAADQGVCPGSLCLVTGKAMTLQGSQNVHLLNLDSLLRIRARIRIRPVQVELCSKCPDGRQFDQRVQLHPALSTSCPAPEDCVR